MRSEIVLHEDRPPELSPGHPQRGLVFEVFASRAVRVTRRPKDQTMARKVRVPGKRDQPQIRYSPRDAAASRALGRAQPPRCPRRRRSRRRARRSTASAHADPARTPPRWRPPTGPPAMVRARSAFRRPASTWVPNRGTSRVKDPSWSVSNPPTTTNLGAQGGERGGEHHLLAVLREQRHAVSPIRCLGQLHGRARALGQGLRSSHAAQLANASSSDSNR